MMEGLWFMTDKPIFKYEFTMEIKTDNKELINYLYSALYPDLSREKMDPYSSIKLDEACLSIYVGSNSQAKFIGILNTIIRLLSILDRLYKLNL